MAYFHQSKDFYNGIRNESSAYRRQYDSSTSVISYNTLKTTEGKTDNVVENLMSSIENKREEIIALNKKLSTFLNTVKLSTASNKSLLEEIEQMKTVFSESLTRIRDEHSEQITNMQSSISKLSETISPLKAQVITLGEDIETKDAEITRLQSKINKLENDLRKKGDMQDQIKQMEWEKKNFRMERQEYLANGIKAQYEYDRLAKYNEYLETTSQAEIEQLRGLLSNFEIVQQNLEEVYKAEFEKAVQSMEKNYKLRKEKHGVYGYQKNRQVKKSYEEEQRFYTHEQTALEERQRKIEEKENELYTLIESLRKVKPDDWDPVISEYRELLTEETKKEESSEPHEDDNDKITGQQAQKTSATISDEQTSNSTEHQADSSYKNELLDEKPEFGEGNQVLDEDAGGEMQNTKPPETISVQQNTSTSDNPDDQLDYRR